MSFDLSIVIVNYRCWEKLADCLSSTLASTGDTQIETIVVDNQSDDGQLPIFSERFSAVKFVKNGGNWGFASGCNRGAAEAQGEHILFLNPDTLVQTDSLAALLESKRRHSEINLMSCRQVDAKGRNQRAFGYFETFWNSFGLIRVILQKLSPARYPSARAEHTQLLECECISGSVVLISRDDFQRLGGWDESFWMYSEDTDLCLRAYQQGMKVAYEPAVKITHLHGGASRQSKEVKALTKSEVIISKHRYIAKHATSRARGFAAHSNLVLRRVLPILLLAALASPLALVGKSSLASIKTKHLLSYYKRWALHGRRHSIRCSPAAER